nr:MAG TPA: hypothetical protein [Caudoviricetes sp.]
MSSRRGRALLCPLSFNRKMLIASGGAEPRPYGMLLFY